MTFNKNGYQYTIDRATGELLVAEGVRARQLGHRESTWRPDVPVVDPTKLTGASKGNVKNIVPASRAGRARLRPLPIRRARDYSTLDRQSVHGLHREAGERIRGTPFIGVSTPYYAGPGGNIGAFIAWDAAPGKRVWEIKEKYPVWSGALVTAGDLAFYGTLDGWFKAVDARTGKCSGVQSGLGRRGRSDHATAAPTANNTWRCMPASAAIGCCSLVTSRSDDPADVREPAGCRQGPRAVHQPGRHGLGLRARDERRQGAGSPARGGLWWGAPRSASSPAGGADRSGRAPARGPRGSDLAGGELHRRERARRAAGQPNSDAV